MGCFDVSCGISSLTIKHGEDALLLLLIPHTDYPDNIDMIRTPVEIETGVMQVSSDGPLGLYMPFCLPIRGKYNDYGSLEDVHNDETVKGLTKYFGATFDQIMEVIHRGCTMHDSEITNIYGNGLVIDRYSGSVTPEWLSEAGFAERDGKFYHPDVPNIIKWTGGKLERTEEQRAYVQFKCKDGEDSPKPHIIYWEDDKWNECWPTQHKSFCESFEKYTAPMGWFADKHGVCLGIKKEHVEKARLLRKLSGMFIDGKFYDKFTECVYTNEYYRSGNGSVLSGYMNKAIMDLIGFKFERLVDSETMQPINEDERISRYNKMLLYSHQETTDYMFGVKTIHSMCTYMYKVDGNKLKEVSTYNYSPFSPNGFAKMFKGVTGRDLDLSGLDGITPFDVTLMQMQDHFSQRQAGIDRMKKLQRQIDKLPEDSEERPALLKKLWSMEDRTENRDSDKDALKYFNFPLVYKLYEKHFIKPSSRFKSACAKFQNFIISLWGINRQLMPSAHFGQHGDFINQIRFNEIIRGSLAEKIIGGEFSDREEMEYVIRMTHGPSWRETREGEETVYSVGETKVASWHEKHKYGVLS